MAGPWVARWRALAARDADAPEPPVIDFARHRYPYAIVWTPIHPITAVLPFVGHMGICDSKGIIFDFGGAISVDHMMFGNPTRYLPLDPKLCKAPPLVESGDQTDPVAARWDRGVYLANERFEPLLHCMVVGHDCHSHVAEALNGLRYRNFAHWNKVLLAGWLFFCGRHVGTRGVLLTWGPFVVLAIIAALVLRFR